MKTKIRNVLGVLAVSIISILAFSPEAWSFSNPPNPPANQPVAPGQQVIQRFDTLSNTWVYAAWVPPLYNSQPNRLWPVIIYFSVIGTAYPNAPIANLTTNNYGPARYLAENAPYAHAFSDSFIVITPWMPSDINPCWTLAVNNQNFFGYFDPFLRHVLHGSLRIDNNRIHTTGYCWGAAIEMKLFTRYNTIPASMAVWSPGDAQGACINDTDAVAACSLKNIPMQWYHNKPDPYSPWQVSQAAVDMIRACGNNQIVYHLGETGAHETWGRPYQISPVNDTVKALYDWMLAQKKSGTTAIAPSFDNQHERAFDETKAPGNFWSIQVDAKSSLDILDMNGKLISRKNGNGQAVKQMTSHLPRGLYMIRLKSEKESSARIALVK